MAVVLKTVTILEQRLTHVENKTKDQNGSANNESHIYQNGSILKTNGLKKANSNGHMNENSLQNNGRSSITLKSNK